MEIRFLGPLRASESGQEIPLGGPRQRLVLAHLLLRANQVVSTEGLISGVWGEAPPAAARATLQSYISHLRKALGADRIEGHGQGYALRVDQEEVDGLRFEALAREGHRLLAGDPDAAARVLGEALALWGGTPFADLQNDASLEAEGARLEQVRVLAVEDRLDAELGRGGGGELVGELEALTAAHPLRERLWGQLMLALYRVGRQAEALAAFERARGLLAEELGIDPSAELRRLHAQVLRQDPALHPGVQALRGYRLLESVGQGPHGVVWRGMQPGFEREVAVKAVHRRLADHPEFIRRFEPEAQAVARIEDPHVVPLYDYWREPGGAYLVMRFLRGGTLRALLERTGPAAETAVTRIAEQVIGALAAAHRQGVVHGDVKPSNVLLDEAGNAYVTDFGIAADVPDGSPAPEVALYVAPERLRGSPPTPAGDVYALGSLLSRLLPEPTAAARTVIDRATADEPQVRHADAGALLAALREVLSPMASPAPAVTGAGTVMAAGPRVPAAVRNPYKGLRAFTEADAGDFFGRETLTARLVTRLRASGPEGRFLAVVGPSGSGKSSVVRAGLLPALRAGALPGSEAWFVAQMTPGSAPFQELAAALLGVAMDPLDTMAAELRHGADGLVNAAGPILPDGHDELLLVVDQLEELFTLVEDEDHRRQFLALLTNAAIDPSSRVRVVVTLRADFYDRPLRYPDFAPVFATSVVNVLPLTAEELERAVAGPAQVVEVQADPGLVARMVADVADQPGALPLLQYALTELFDRRQNATLTAGVYAEIGGVTGALARRAEQVHAGLPDSARRGARQLFLRLVAPGEGTEDTRRRVPRAQLLSLADDPGQMEQAIEAFGRARLLSFDRDPGTREPTVEVAHEALLREWPDLRRWIDAARSDLRTHQRVAAAAREWLDAGRDPSFLASGSRLDQFAAWHEHADLRLTPDERAFLDASLAERDRRRAEEGARQVREQELERRSWRRLRALVAVFAAATLIAAGLTVVALRQTDRLATQVRVATARELAAAAVANLDVDPERSILLALEAVDATWQRDGTAVREAEEALHRAVARSRVVYSLPQGDGLGLSSDGTRFATTGPDGTATVWDLDTGEKVLGLSGHEGAVSRVAFSPDDRIIATGSDDGTVRLWDAARGEERDVLRGHEGWAHSVAFSPDGARLATTGEDGTVRLWDVASATEARVLTDHGGWTLGVAFSPDGTRLASASYDGTARIWDAATGEPTLVLSEHPSCCEHVAFSPDGRQVATSGQDGTARTWDARTGEPLVTFYGHSGILDAVAFSPDGNRIATGATDATAKVWDAVTGQELLTLSGHPGAIRQVAFAPDGQRLITSGHDGTARLWDISLEGSRDWLTVQGPSDRPWVGVAFSPDGRRVAAPREDPHGVTIWDTATGAEVVALTGNDAAVDSVAFNPDGDLLAANTFDQPVLVWDVRTGALRATLAPHEENAWAVAFSPDGRLVTTGGFDGTVTVSDAATGEEQATSESGSDIVGVARFSPDGQHLATVISEMGRRGGVTVWDADTLDELHTFDAHTEDVTGLAVGPDGRLITAAWDGTAKVWDLESGELIVTFGGHDAPVNDVAISPDGTRGATTSHDRTVKLWEAATGRELLTLYGDDILYGVAFSPDGRLLATASRDGKVALYLLPIEEFVEVARERVTRSLTEDECRQYLQSRECPTATR